ncbi:MAG: hypothetical protein E6G44_04560 [Actinobacteria bacterium]|nr:MAG: hypothetical protein E6G44_04560 [Actinomycetota bacterium]
MRTEERRSVEPKPGAPSRRRPLSSSWVAATVVVGLVAVIVLAFYLSVFPRRNFTVPIGWDSSEYLWRTRLAQHVGVTDIARPLPMSVSPKSGRPAYPIVAASLTSLLRVDLFRFGMAFPAVLAAVIGLAAGAFVGAVLRRPVWDVAVVALAVSLSTSIVTLLTPEGYLDTMLAAGVFIAAAMAVAFALDDRWALIPAVVLIAAGVTTHFSFFAFMAATLLLAGAAFVPDSWARWRRGEDRLLDTPTVRVGEAVAGGGALGAAMLFLVLGNHLRGPRLNLSELRKKLRRDLGKYHFRLTAPIAAVGAASLVGPARSGGTRTERTRARFALAFLLSWCIVAFAGYVGQAWLHRRIPAHRFLSFGLAVPILGGLALLWAGRAVARYIRPLGVAVVAAGLAASAFVAHQQWFATKSWTDPGQAADARTAGAYLEAVRIPVDRPIVFLVSTRDWSTASLMLHTLRANLPVERIAHTYEFVGSPEQYLAERPAPFGLSRNTFQRMRVTYGQDPVALLLPHFNEVSYDAWAAAHPETDVAFRLAVIRGPAPPRRLPPIQPPVGRVPPLELALVAMGSLAVLGATGLGWTLAMFGAALKTAERLAVAPAIGIAVLVLGGIVFDRAGLRLAGATGAALPIVVAAMGWGAAALVLRRTRRVVV